MQPYLAKYLNKYLSLAGFKFLKILNFLTISLMDTEYWQFVFSKLITKYTSVCLETKIYTAK